MGRKSPDGTGNCLNNKKKGTGNGRVIIISGRYKWQAFSVMKHEIYDSE